MAKAKKKASKKKAGKESQPARKPKAKVKATARRQAPAEAEIHRQPSPRARFRPGPAHLFGLSRSWARAGDRRHGAGACDPHDQAVRADEVAIPHYHDVEFQMVYVLKGWFKSEFEGEGAHTFHAGACWIQPPRIKHTVLGYSDDCELLEIVLPADFETVTLAK